MLLCPRMKSNFLSLWLRAAGFPAGVGLQQGRHYRVHRAINAELNYPEYEVIVINDGSLGRHAGRAEVRVRAGRVSQGVLGAPRSGTDS